MSSNPNYNNAGRPKPRRIYYLGRRKPREIWFVSYYRPKIVLRYRALVDHAAPSNMSLVDQLWLIFDEAVTNKEYLTKCEIVMILRGYPTWDKPTVPELSETNDLLSQWRKHFRSYSNNPNPILVYSQRIMIDKVGRQQIIKPIDNLKDYERVIGKHLDREIKALQDIQETNRYVASLAKRRLQTMRDEITRRIVSTGNSNISYGKKKRSYKKSKDKGKDNNNNTGVA